MTSKTTPASTGTPHDWRAAAKQSAWAWPAQVALAGLVVVGLNMLWRGNNGWSIGPISSDLYSMLWTLVCILATSLPVWIRVTRQRMTGVAPMGVARQAALAGGWLLAALLLTPTFGVEHRDYDTWSENEVKDLTVTWMKRSLLETLTQPLSRNDELAWLQSNYSASYIPADVYCARRSTRLYPFFGSVRDDYLANALAAASHNGDNQPPAAALAQGIARCRVEGPAMRAEGHTKESALMKGDLDRFFALALLERDRNKSVVLEDTDLPANVLAKVNATLAARPDETLRWLDDPNADLKAGQVRRLTPLAVAEALERRDDATRLEQRSP